MTSATSAIRRRDSRRVGGFTLIELMIVIGIIILLLAIALPVLVSVMKSGNRARAAADLQTISVALDAYKQDFGDYPRPSGDDLGAATLCAALIAPAPAFDPPLAFDSTKSYTVGQNVLNGTEYACIQANPASPASVAPPNTTYWTPVTEAAQAYNNAKQYLPGEVANQSGIIYVCIADTTGTAPPNTTYWAQYDAVAGKAGDGARGSGFCARVGGKVYSGYLQPDKFKLRTTVSVGAPAVTTYGLAILDHTSAAPILYFPANATRTNVNAANTAPAANGFLRVLSTETPPTALYDVRNNITAFVRYPAEAGVTTNAEHRITAMLGDLSADGRIDPSSSPAESAATTGNYILWAAGPDGLFGPSDITSASSVQDKVTAVSKCDDVTNFR